MQDLESGLSYMLKIEVANKPIIEGPAYLALQNFIDMLGEVRYTIYRPLITISFFSISTHNALKLLSQAVNNEPRKWPTILVKINSSFFTPL